MGGITIESLEKSFKSSRVLHSIDLRVEKGEFVTLLGPSGCGKTTTLRCIAGLEAPTGGRITIGESAVVDSDLSRFVPPHKRKVGLVFQSYAIWPHMSALSNVEYPLRRRKQGSRASQRDAAVKALDAVGMGTLKRRYPHELSGGQQQRVALARGLVSAGEVMLYDEPLSNLDAKLRVAMRDEIRRLHDEFGHTSIYVTHDQEEAFAISDRIVIMNAGHIEQVGTPSEIFTRPATRYVADFVGYENILVADEPRSDGRVTSAGGLAVGIDGLRGGESLAFRSSRVALGAGGASDALRFRATVTRVVYAGDDVVCHLRTEADTVIVARLPADAAIGVGESADFHVASSDVVTLTE